MATSMAVAEHPDPADRRLPRTQSGPSLGRLREVLAGYARDGIHVEYGNGDAPVPSIEKVDLWGDETAFVTFCLVEHALLVRTSDGRVVSSQVRSQRNKAQLHHSTGLWRIDAMRTLGTWADDEGCDR
ncbi:hypothetical protein KSP35_14530 [Aquihabitans sp. G128]|uniref:hypothetical protein n=1 Tax=Aquihabitans sp. G128 TaxID=2849779 RepID=UPI001C21DC4B|nr:hypothetical protein [Aquihabitans sp. G128]QXC59598.1 hypothetical protein KSP35_14530 [Aquihabitans sp. G128]